MQSLDLPCDRTVDPPLHDPSTISDDSSPIHHSAGDKTSRVGFNSMNVKFEDDVQVNTLSKSNGGNSVVVKRERPTRACTQRAAAKMQAAAEAEAKIEAERKKRKVSRRQKLAARLLKEDEENGFGDEEDGYEMGNLDYMEEGDSSLQAEYSKIVTPLVGDLEVTQMPRWNIRSMWELASILNFLNVFRPLLNIKAEFSAEELETALITPNTTLVDVHIPLLKAIPPVARMALGYDTWVTVLCKKLKHWWHWVAEGDLPIVASHGAEVEAYNALDPSVRVVILKALCDIRVEQEDIKNYVDGSIKHGVHPSTFRKERVGGNSHGTLYWYEDDPVIGHRLYREIRKVEVKKEKGRNVPPIPHSSYQWEAVATNLDEFLDVSEKLFSSKNFTEVSVGKKLRNDMLPEIERVHKKKEKLLKKQQREALMLDNMMNLDFAAGRSRRDRKPVSYTYDDYDRSINEAIQATKKQQLSPEAFERRDPYDREVSTNSRWTDSLQYTGHDSFSMPSPNSADEIGIYDDQKTQALNRSHRQKQRPQRYYSINDFVEPVSDNEADFGTDDDDIVGEVVYDEEYLRRKKKRRKTPSSSEGDDEDYREDEENPEEVEEDDDDDDDSFNEDNDEPRRSRSMRGRTRRETRLRSVGDFKSGLRRSKRATRNRVSYRQMEMSESEPEFTKSSESSSFNEQSDASGHNPELSMDSRDSEDKLNVPQQMDVDDHRPTENQHFESDDREEPLHSRDTDDGGGVRKQRFLDLNELAPCSGFDDGLDSMRDDDDDDDGPSYDF